MVAGPAAGKIKPDVAIRMVDARHADFGPIVQLRNAPLRQQPFDADLLSGGVFAYFGKKAGHVVVVEEDDVAGRVLVKKVIAQRVIELVHSPHPEVSLTAGWMPENSI